MRPAVEAIAARLGRGAQVLLQPLVEGVVVVRPLPLDGLLVGERRLAQTVRRVAQHEGAHVQAGVAVDGPANRAFVTNRADNTVSILEARSGTVLRTVPVGRGPVSLAVDTRTQRLFVVNEAGGSVSVLDARTGRRYRSVRVGALRPQPQAQANPVDLAVDVRWGHVFVLNDGPIAPGGQALPALKARNAVDADALERFIVELRKTLATLAVRY